jgi:hypothetical protein
MVVLTKLATDFYKSLGFKNRTAGINFTKHVLQVTANKYKTEDDFKQFLKPKISKLSSLGIDINDKKNSATIKVLKDIKKLESKKGKKQNEEIEKKIKKLEKAINTGVWHISGTIKIKQKYNKVEVAKNETDIQNFIRNNGGSIRESINELTQKEKRIKDGKPGNTYYVYYKGQFAVDYDMFGMSGVDRFYRQEFKVRKVKGSSFNPDFIIITKIDYDRNPNHYSKLKPYVDKFWDKLQTESVNEDWSQKYKNSIDCNNPKGFSQKAHCAGKNESMNLEERLNLFLEKNVPTDPQKWAASIAAAKKKFDVYPSAYANGWAAKNYKEKGGGWKTAK